MIAVSRDFVMDQVGDEAIFFEDFDEALIGVAQRCSTIVSMYDANRCIELLQTKHGMDEEEAREYFDFNVIQAWVGDSTPVFAWLPQTEGEF